MGSIMNGMAASRRGNPVRGDLPDFFGLHAAADSPRVNHESAYGVRLHSRLDRAGRRRSDPSTGRAAGRSPCDSRDHGDSASRCVGNGRSVASHAEEQEWSCRARAHAAEAWLDRSHEIRVGERSCARGVRACRFLRWCAANHSHLDWIGSGAHSRSQRAIGEGWNPGSRREHAESRAVRPRNAGVSKHVLPPGVRRIAVEAAHPMSWYRWVGDDGMIIGIDRFGASAPYKDIYTHLGLTVDRIVDIAKQMVKPAESTKA